MVCSPQVYLGELHIQVTDFLAHFWGAQQICQSLVEEAAQGPLADVVFLLGLY